METYEQSSDTCTVAIRKLVLVMAMTMAVFIMSAIPAYAESISESEIIEGVLFCREFPVELRLNDVVVTATTKPVIIKERTLIPARALFEKMGASISWNEDSRTVGIVYGDKNISLVIDSNKYTVNGATYETDVPPLIVESSTMIPVRVVATALGCEVKWDDEARIVNIIAPVNQAQGDASQNGNAQDNGSQSGSESSSSGNSQYVSPKEGIPSLDPSLSNFLVVIDAGHGGVDSGAVHKDENGKVTIQEKDVTLDVALRLEQYLNAAGVKTYMMRTDDTAVQIYDRPAKANELGAELYVSVHINSNTSDSPKGTETYYNTKESESSYIIDSKALAESVQKEVQSALGTYNRGAKNEPAYIVLNRTVMPAIIIEGAFISNSEDRAAMMTDAFRDSYAYGAARGIVIAMNSSI